MPDPKWIRVRDTSGHELTIRGDLPKGHPRGIQEGVEHLDKPATTISGEPLPPKHRTDLGTPVPGGKVARKRAASKPRQSAAPKPVPAKPEDNTNTTGHVADTTMED